MIVLIGENIFRCLASTLSLFMLCAEEIQGKPHGNAVDCHHLCPSRQLKDFSVHGRQMPTDGCVCALKESRPVTFYTKLRRPSVCRNPKTENLYLFIISTNNSLCPTIEGPLNKHLGQRIAAGKACETLSLTHVIEHADCWERGRVKLALPTLQAFYNNVWQCKRRRGNTASRGSRSIHRNLIGRANARRKNTSTQSETNHTT